ncbi:MAG: cytochrome c [Planctomycetota bacterium]|nr:cytochrome c [Planctomycetota bacterium]
MFQSFHQPSAAHNQRNATHKALSGKIALLVSAIALSSLGCTPQAPQQLAFEPNYLFAHRLTVEQDVPTDQFLSDSKDLLIDWFGTPDNPKLPPAFADSDYAELISLDTMRPAVGPAPESIEPGDHGLYRQLCTSCHGETGQGRGTVAASQNPYPRDFRKGVFKYKSALRNSKPLKSDIAHVLRHGLAGSQMPLFNKLSDKQIDALVDYVVYLSIRGEFERQLLAMGTADLDPEESFNSDPTKRERIYDVSYRGSTVEAQAEAFKDQTSTAEDLLTEIVDKWIEAEDEVEEVEAPEDVPVPGLTPEADIDADALSASIAKGRELFVGSVAACSKCHGDSGKGDGKQLPDYDEWTKDWTVQINVKPDDMNAILPFLARGGMKPQPILPRNLVEGNFRGGRDPIAVYRRILYGIAGGPMPAAALASKPGEPGLTTDDIWHLVNFVTSLKTTPPASSEPATAEPSTKEPSTKEPAASVTIR